MLSARKYEIPLSHIFICPFYAPHTYTDSSFQFQAIYHGVFQQCQLPEEHQKGVHKKIEAQESPASGIPHSCRDLPGIHLCAALPSLR
jgi:hypothetical protein